MLMMHLHYIDRCENCINDDFLINNQYPRVVDVTKNQCLNKIASKK